MYLLTSETHTAPECLVRRSNEAVDRQDVRKVQTTAKDKLGELLHARNLMFLEEDKVADGETIAAFKRSVDGEAVRKQESTNNQSRLIRVTNLGQPCTRVRILSFHYGR